MSSTTISDLPSSAAVEAMRTRSDLKGLLLMALIIGVCFLLVDLHAFLHTGQHLPAVIRDPSAYLDRFEYVGGRENAYSVAIEVTIWSLVGIHCRLAHVVCHEAAGKGVDLSQMLLLWFSTALFGWGTTAVFVGMLRLVSFSIGDVTFALHRIDAVVSLAFMFGFYNEATRRLLSVVRDIVRRAAASGADEPAQEPRPPERGSGTAAAPTV